MLLGCVDLGRPPHLGPDSTAPDTTDGATSDAPGGSTTDGPGRGTSDAPGGSTTDGPDLPDAAPPGPPDATVSADVAPGPSVDAAVPPLPGLVGHWAFDETQGSSANDSSSVPNNGTLVNGPTWSTMTIPPMKFPNSGSLSFDEIGRAHV